MRNLRRGMAMAGIGALLLTFAHPTARADYFVAKTGATGCNDLNQADGAAHYFHYVDLSAAMTAATDYARKYALDPTDIDTRTETNPTSSTDVDVMDRAYVDYCGFGWYTPEEGGVIGTTKCDKVLASGACDKHSIRYSSRYTDAANITSRRWLACHENGHAVGLSHRSETDGCMTPTETARHTLVYSPHAIAHINATY